MVFQAFTAFFSLNSGVCTLHGVALRDQKRLRWIPGADMGQHGWIIHYGHQMA